MNTTEKIHLTEEKETLFITLYAKAMDYRDKHSILHDKTADEMIRSIEYDFSKHGSFGNNIIAIRAKHFDEWVKDFITVNKNAVVVYPGCGLDTRITRINPEAIVSWFDMDYPEVIQLRKQFFSNKEGYTMIESSVTERAWLKQIPTDRPTIIIAEGLLEYLTREDVKIFLTRMTEHFKYGQIIFDIMNSFAIQSGKEKLKETTGAVHKWAVDEIGELDKLNPRLKRMETVPVFASKHTRRLPLKLLLLYRVLSIFPKFKNMIRLMKYRF
jgi:O-methyltransferase involved in polyketide biosynthesis